MILWENGVVFGAITWYFCKKKKLSITLVFAGNTLKRWVNTMILFGKQSYTVQKLWHFIVQCRLLLSNVLIWGKYSIIWGNKMVLGKKVGFKSNILVFAANKLEFWENTMLFFGDKYCGNSLSNVGIYYPMWYLGKYNSNFGENIVVLRANAVVFWGKLGGIWGKHSGNLGKYSGMWGI